jgi:hypothetical protein
VNAAWRKPGSASPPTGRGPLWRCSGTVPPGGCRTRRWPKGTKALNSVLLRHNCKARNITNIDDFACIKHQLSACGKLGLLDKGERNTLEDALNLRNRCNHQTKYELGTAKVNFFIEDVVGTVWP